MLRLRLRAQLESLRLDRLCHPKPQPATKQHLVGQNANMYLHIVKFAPHLSKPSAHQADAEQPSVVPAPPSTSFLSDLPPQGVSNSKWGGASPRLRPRRPKARQPGIIPTGPLVGLPKRPRTDRHRALALDQVCNLVNAAAFAEAQGRPLVVELTLAWRLMRGFSEKRWADIQVRAVDYMSRWLRRRKIVPTFVWDRERVPGCGVHTHVLLHLPRRGTAKLAKELRNYISRTFGFQDRVKPSDKLERGVDVSYGRFGAWTREMRAGSLRYALKGFDHRAFRYVGQDGTTENLGAALGIDHRGQQGFIDIKRCGTSQNIGPAARRKAGWPEIKDVDGLRRALNPDCDDSNGHIEDVGSSREAPVVSTRPRRTLRPDASISALR